MHHRDTEGTEKALDLPLSDSGLHPRNPEKFSLDYLCVLRVSVVNPFETL